MGASSSKGDREKDVCVDSPEHTKEGARVLCLDCDRKTQKAPPAAASTSNDCRDSYESVSNCMDQNRGQGG